MGLSTMTMPALIETSSTSPQLLQHWQRVFDRGHVQGPALSITTALIYTYVAWTQAALSASWRPFAIAAGVTLGMVPYTLILMDRVNKELFRAVEQSRSGKESIDRQRAEKLIRQWTALHAGRSLFPLAGAVVGLLAMLGVASF